MLAIGLMSGTSLDGVDAVLVKIENEKFEELKFITYPYDEDFKKRIMRNLSDESAKLSEISSLNFELGYKFVSAIDMLLDGTSYKYQDIEFVSSHGQTIWHDPYGNRCDKAVSNTLQIGSASVINYQTGIKVISNFRAKDICAKGQGAPLVPFSEYYLYRSKEENRVFQNIGGISNCTFIPKSENENEVISFDNGPGNIMIDYFMNKYYNLPFDKDGHFASLGTIIDEMFDYLKKDEYIYLPYPKSTGREKYSKEFMEEMIDKFSLNDKKKEDVIRTVTEFTAYAISYSYMHLLQGVDKVIVSGGGSHNKFLIDRIKEYTHLPIITGNEFGINSDSKEALAFVVMGYMTLNHKTSNIKSATGAEKNVILGDITY